MAKTIRLANGGYVTRAWHGEEYFFEVGNENGGDHATITPTPEELFRIATLFRRAAVKMKVTAKEPYEASTFTYLEKHREDCPQRLYGKLVTCTCGGEL